MSQTAAITQLPPPLPTVRLPRAAACGKCYEGLAFGSLACALLGVFLFSPLFGIVAVVLGAIARKKMRGSGNFLGYGVARAGLIIGWTEVAFLVLIALVAVTAIIAASLPVHPAGPAHVAVRLIAI